MALRKLLGVHTPFYTARSVIEYYTQGGSTVNLAALDISKAFDRVDHCGLFVKLMNKRVQWRQREFKVGGSSLVSRLSACLTEANWWRLIAE